MENAKKPKGDNIEEKPRVTTNPILPEIQETEKVAMKPHSKDEIEEVAKSEVESLESDDPLSEPIWWDTRFTHKRDIPWVCPWGRRCTNVDMSTYEEWPLYDCFDNLDEDDCLDDLSENDFGHLNKKDEKYEERWEKCFHVGKLPGEE
ncbi:hypothetical protein OROHE_010256 [Orobanche hederae]